MNFRVRRIVVLSSASQKLNKEEIRVLYNKRISKTPYFYCGQFTQSAGLPVDALFVHVPPNCGFFHLPCGPIISVVMS